MNRPGGIPGRRSPGGMLPSACRPARSRRRPRVRLRGAQLPGRRVPGRAVAPVAQPAGVHHMGLSGGRDGGNRYLVLGLGTGPGADLAVPPERDELIAYGAFAGRQRNHLAGHGCPGPAPSATPPLRWLVSKQPPPSGRSRGRLCGSGRELADDYACGRGGARQRERGGAQRGQVAAADGEPGDRAGLALIDIQQAAVRAQPGVNRACAGPLAGLLPGSRDNAPLAVMFGPCSD